MYTRPIERNFGLRFRPYADHLSAVEAIRWTAKTGRMIDGVGKAPIVTAASKGEPLMFLFVFATDNACIAHKLGKA